MSAEQLLALARQDAFRPSGRFDLLAEDHVPFDELTGRSRYENQLIETLTGPESLCLIIGGTGTGKTSLIAWACHHLPETHVPLRVPVAALEDPGDIKVLAGTVIVAAARAVGQLSDEQRSDLAGYAADRRTTRPVAKRIRGGTLGGGPIPAQLHLDLGALYEDFERNGLPLDRFHGLDRLISVFRERGKCLVLVLEDTDAMAGGPGQHADQFLSMVLVLSRELKAPIVVAVQDHHRGSAYERLRQMGREIAIPPLMETERGLRRIFARRLPRAGLAGVQVREIIDDDALKGLITVYDESGRNLRQLLAVLQFAVDHAVDEDAELLTFPHIRHAIQATRPGGSQ
jgi:Cdc6-like AAA superfamily ATPase